MDKRDGIVKMSSGTVIDRRLAGKNKSIGNRERFLRRHKEQLREAVRRAVAGKSIKDVATGGEVHVPRKDIQEPVFGHSQQGGRRWIIHPGNKDHVTGDRIEKPEGGGGKGSGSGQASDSGEGEDDFIFQLSREEFLNIFFEDLALPNAIMNQLALSPEYKMVRSGFSTDGTPNNLDVVRSKKNELGRLIGSGVPAKIRDCLEQLELLEWLWEHSPEQLARDPERYAQSLAEYERLVGELEAQLAALRERRGQIRLDPVDLRYRSRVRQQIPMFKAVMFCLMDVSGSMDEARKDLAKRFFILLYLFLTKHYDRIDIVFLRHHTQAEEVDEDTFFNGRETGGTIVSSVLTLMDEIVRKRYPTSEWNIYGAQASDGDNWHNDSGRCVDILRERILPLTRYFAYIQVAKEEQNLWDEYAELASDSNWKGRFAMTKALTREEIYPVFRDLFAKEPKK